MGINELARAAGSVAIAIALSACAPLIAQSPGGSLSPANAVKQPDAAHLMLFGHDVVAYFTESKHLLGSPAYTSRVGEVTFRFASAEHKALFDKSPEKYTPQYGGYCSNGIVYGIPWGGNAEDWRIIDGKLYIFGGEGSQDAFMLDSQRNIALADRYWKIEIAGSNAFLQRAKRFTVARVSHYKTGEQLEKEVAAAKPK